MLIGKSRTSLTKAEQIELLKSYIEISGGQKRIIAILAEAGILVGKTWLSSAIHIKNTWSDTFAFRRIASAFRF